jgi:hypothetical protein
VKRLLLLAAILVMLLLATATAFAQTGPDTPVSGRPGEGPAAPFDCEALRATGADIDCGVIKDAGTASDGQYASYDQYGADRSSEIGASGGTSGAGLLPSTGGFALLPSSVGFILIASGLLAHRLIRSGR